MIENDIENEYHFTYDNSSEKKKNDLRYQIIDLCVCKRRGYYGEKGSPERIKVAKKILNLRKNLMKLTFRSYK